MGVAAQKEPAIELRKMASKLNRWCLAEAKKNIKLAKEKIKDRDWMKRASEMSKEMVLRNSRITPTQLAKEHCDYLKMRACARDRAWGEKVWIDPSARERIKKITGKLPRCRVKGNLKSPRIGRGGKIATMTQVRGRKFRLWYTTPIGFERIIDVEATTKVEAMEKGKAQVPEGSVLRSISPY